MEETYKKFETMLDDEGYNSTEPRRLIFKAIEKSQIPLSYSEIQAKVALTNRATIYRTLQLFEQLTIVKKVWFGRFARYELGDAFRHHHHHLHY